MNDPFFKPDAEQMSICPEDICDKPDDAGNFNPRCQHILTREGIPIRQCRRAATAGSPYCDAHNATEAAMDRWEFIHAVEALRWTIYSVGRWCGYARQTIDRWTDGSARVPGPVAHWLRQRMAGELTNPPKR